MQPMQVCWIDYLNVTVGGVVRMQKTGTSKTLFLVGFQFYGSLAFKLHLDTGRWAIRRSGVCSAMYTRL